MSIILSIILGTETFKSIPYYRSQKKKAITSK